MIRILGPTCLLQYVRAALPKQGQHKIGGGDADVYPSTKDHNTHKNANDHLEVATPHVPTKNHPAAASLETQIQDSSNTANTHQDSSTKSINMIYFSFSFFFFEKKVELRKNFWFPETLKRYFIGLNQYNLLI